MRTTLLLLALLTSPATAAVIDVNPGPGTPLQDAIDAANAGDKLLVHDGTYAEAINVDKSLRIVGDNPLTVIVNAGCAAAVAITVGADDVSIRSVTATGGTVSDIAVTSRQRVQVKDSRAVRGCVGAQYGINVVQSARVVLVHNHAQDYTAAGIRIGTIAVDGKIRAVKNSSSSNGRGILVGDSPLGSGVQLRGNGLTSNTDGIFLTNTKGASVAANIVTSSTGNGIWADTTATDNRIRDNQILTSGTLDVRDDSNDNCWRRNRYTTGTPNLNGC